MEVGEAVVIADLEAGIGTLTRLGDGVLDAVVVVTETTPRSLEVAARALALADERRVTRRIAVANRSRGEEDLAVVRAALPGVDVVAVPDDDAIVQAERHGDAPLDTHPNAPAVRALEGLAERLGSA